ncbi:PIN domain-like protein [Annulohypoxylon stygium]|nr:PIN domain-like protein [Annulohypoxylon stygium]
MGVTGLWTVVQPCARPTNLATLNRKRLAVDASIWIYQFLKAVRDKEGNALRNSHVVGFFRRICKLLWFGIRPVFVFDGGAPALKRQTIRSRKQRREGRREDAVRTAGKLLAVQMQRMIEEEDEKRKKRREQKEPEREDPVEEIPDADQLVYVDELGMDQAERKKNRKFYKQDAYHLPDLDTNIQGMGQPDDPRIMSIEELEEYARQFNSGEDINVYDFSKIDFEGEFFKSLPPVDRYNILNAARIRSRLRMGLSKEQLDGMFPDRMAFSRFQIERVRERNHLTQRLMQEAGMTGTDLTLAKNARIAGDKDREYILVKNDGAEGGWALGVISKERDHGEMHKPIDVDALDFQFQDKEEDEWEDEEEFEDVPIEGINRLPKARAEPQTIVDEDDEDSLFVGGNTTNGIDDLFEAQNEEGNPLMGDEEEDLNRAIALSLRNQHGVTSPGQQEVEEEEEVFEDVPAPEWTQKPVEHSRPIATTSGSMIAHIVNNRANAAVSKPASKPVPERRNSDDSSDSEIDLRAALSRKKKKKAPIFKQPVTATVPNVKNPFDGPLPFEKLDWKSSIFAKKDKPLPTKVTKDVNMEPNSDDELAGGFVREDGGNDAQESKTQENINDGNEEARPLPPWMMQNESDIRESLKAQRVIEIEIDEQDREAAFEEERQRRKEAIIEIESSDDESDVQIIEAPPQFRPKSPSRGETSTTTRLSPATLTRINTPIANEEDQAEDTRYADIVQEHMDSQVEEVDDTVHANSPPRSASPEPEFEEVEIMQPPEDSAVDDTIAQAESPKPIFEDVDVPVSEAQIEPQHPIPEVAKQPDAPDLAVGDEVIFGDEFDDDEFSDPEEEELLVQMAEEAQEHARFASQLNNKSEKENQEAYERELKALRSQQKKDRRDADEVTQVMITECQALLRYFGIPYITAPMEAEAQCAELVRLGLVDGIVTDDSDTFLFGGTRVYKNMFNSNKYVECYLGSDLEKELSLSREQLISLAQLLGSDYTEGLPGVGPVTAVEILSEFPGKDGLTQFKEWWQDVQINGRPKEADQNSVFRRKFRKSQGTKLFLPSGFPSPAVFDAYLHPEVDSATEQFQWGVPDVAGLRLFLMSTIGWSEDRTDEVLMPVVRDMNRREAEGTQSNITRFFEGSVGVGAKEAFAPRQRVQGSKRMAQAVNKLRAKAVADGMPAAAEAGDATPEDESLAPPPRQRKRKARNTITIDDDDDDGDEYVDGEANGEGNGQDKGKGVRKAAGKQKGKGVRRGKKAKASA